MINRLTLLDNVFPLAAAKVCCTDTTDRPLFILPPATLYSIISSTHSTASTGISYTVGKSAIISLVNLIRINVVVYKHKN